MSLRPPDACDCAAESAADDREDAIADKRNAQARERGCPLCGGTGGNCPECCDDEQEDEDDDCCGFCMGAGCELCRGSGKAQTFGLAGAPL